MVSLAEIQALSKEIVEAIHPEKVLLFGSYAKGTATEKSDVDILVVVDELKEKKYKILSAINKKVWSKFDFEKDIKLYSKAEIEDWKNVKQAFVTTAIRESKTIYEKPK